MPIQMTRNSEMSPWVIGNCDMDNYWTSPLYGHRSKKCVKRDNGKGFAEERRGGEGGRRDVDGAVVNEFALNFAEIVLPRVRARRRAGFKDGDHLASRRVTKYKLNLDSRIR
ncbi:hypothetical protein PoB_004370300 [Plakobranchus ocellatus]|uniref:Uncharacterized protein n=1 Tax=Plakobranchus ocellatus TaxID=259542 RepID=A0AAV4BCB7_9GAST|nr:hypothetical protein PoB_004370300 [Plakobranchus ocellatus]